MPAAIGNNNFALNTLNRINSSSQSTLQRIITGSNFPSASFGGAAYSILQRLNSNIGAIGQSVQNTQNAGAMLRTAAGATGNTVSALNSIREILINAANGTNNDQDRAALQENINQLVRQVDNNANIQYNGMNLLDGSRRSVMIAGINGYENIEIGDMRARSLGLADQRGNVTLDISTEEGIRSALGAVNGAINTAQRLDNVLGEAIDSDTLGRSLNEATSQGAYLRRLDYQTQNYMTMEENQQEAQSRLGDADIARQISDLRRDQTREELARWASQMYLQSRMSILNLLP